MPLAFLPLRLQAPALSLLLLPLLSLALLLGLTFQPSPLLLLRARLQRPQDRTDLLLQRLLGRVGPFLLPAVAVARLLADQQFQFAGRLELLGRRDTLPVVRTAARLIGDVPDRLLPFAEADLVRPAVDGEQWPRLPALLRHRDLAVACEGLFSEEPEQ